MAAIRPREARDTVRAARGTGPAAVRNLREGPRRVCAVKGGVFQWSTVVSIVVGRLHEGMDLPDLVRRQSQAEGRHLRSFAAMDHRFQEALVAELGGE